VTERLLGKKDGAIGWVVFNNPERRNAVSIDMWEAIPTVLEDFAKDAEIRVVVLAGAGDKGLCRRRRYLAVREAALERGGRAALRGNRRSRAGEAAELREAGASP
jgi:enoyl-CoA hydratase/carnithine racemase